MKIEMTEGRIYLLVDDNADGLSRDVENSASGSVVDLVGHTFLDGTITLDVDDVSLKSTVRIWITSSRCFTLW